MQLIPAVLKGVRNTMATTLRADAVVEDVHDHTVPMIMSAVGAPEVSAPDTKAPVVNLAALAVLCVAGLLHSTV